VLSYSLHCGERFFSIFVIRNHYVSVPFPFGIRSVSILYPFCTRSVPLLHLFRSRSFRILVPVLYPFRSCSQTRSLLGFFWLVLHVCLLEFCLSIFAVSCSKFEWSKTVSNLKHWLRLESARTALCKWATFTCQTSLSRTFANSPDSPHKPVSLVWFYFQDATKGPQVFYHDYNVSSFKVTPLSLQWLPSHL